MVTAHKITLDPNNRQRSYLRRCAGGSRWVYNWGLAEWRKQYSLHQAHLEAGGSKDSAPPKPSAIALSRQLTQLKHNDPDKHWITELPAAILYPALEDLQSGFQNWWRSLKKGDRAFRAPQFKKRGERGSFSFSNQALEVGEFRVRLPKLGWVRARESVRWAGPIKTCTVSTDGTRWYLAVTVEVDGLPTVEHLHQGRVGVDLGVKMLATYVKPDGALVEVEGPKALRRNIRRLKHEGRNLSRKQKGSANFRKQKRKLAKLHARVAQIRAGALHQLSHQLTRTYDEIVIEDLHVKGMLRNAHLARSIGDAGWGEFRRQLEYKAKQRGVSVHVADRFFASSKTCSACGHKHISLRLSEREWTCPECGVVHHRDANASKTLRAWKRPENAAAGQAVKSACGGGSAGAEISIGVKLPPVKQEAGSADQSAHRSGTPQGDQPTILAAAAPDGERAGHKEISTFARDQQPIEGEPIATQPSQSRVRHYRLKRSCSQMELPGLGTQRVAYGRSQCP